MLRGLQEFFSSKQSTEQKADEQLFTNKHENKEKIQDLITQVWSTIENNNVSELKTLLNSRDFPNIAKLFAHDAYQRNPVMFSVSQKSECFPLLLNARGVSELIYRPEKQNIPHYFAIEQNMKKLEELEAWALNRKYPSLLLLANRNGDLPITCAIKHVFDSKTNDAAASHDVSNDDDIMTVSFTQTLWQMTLSAWERHKNLNPRAEVSSVFNRLNLIPGTNLLAIAARSDVNATIVRDLCETLHVDVHVSHKKTCNTPLHVAVMHGAVKNIQILLEANAFSNLNNKQGDTPLHLAAGDVNLLPCLKILLAHKPNGPLPLLVNWCNRPEGNTPLHIACIARNVTAVELLLKHGALPDIANIEGKLPVQLVDPAEQSLLALLETEDGEMEKKNTNNQEKDSILLNDTAEKRRTCQLQIVSDLHIEFLKKNYKNATKMCFHILDVKAPTLCLLGDIGVPHKDRELYEEFLFACASRWERVIVILGNHEHYGGLYSKSYTILNEIVADARSLGKIHFMDRDVMEIDGVVILGCTLWSKVNLASHDDMVTVQSSLADYNYIYIEDADHKKGRRRVDVQRTTQWHEADVQFLKSELNKAVMNNKHVIVLTHHCPLQRTGSSKPDYIDGVMSQAFCTDLSELCVFPVRAWAYGHTHWANDVYVPSSLVSSLKPPCRVVSNPKGYPHESLPFLPDFVLSVQE